MGEKLTKLCCSMGIPVKEITREQMEVYKIQKMEEDSLIKSMTELDKIMNGNVIVMGGFCACSQVLGFRRMRRTSNDLDCVTDEEGIKSLFNYFEGALFQTENYGDVFLEYNGIPVGFDVDETHDWIIPQRFFDEAIRFQFNDGGLTSISPEFLMALKARRSILKGRFFGKDAVDTANMLLAPLYRAELSQTDFDKICSYMREHSSDSCEEINRYIDFICLYENHLKKEETPLFVEVLSRLRKSVQRVY